MSHSSVGWDDAIFLNQNVPPHNVPIERARPPRITFLGMPFDPVTQDQVLALLTDRTPDSPFGYVATPNVQHVVQADCDPRIPPLYNDAWLSLCDSQPIRRIGHWSGRDLPLVTGSDLTATLFHEVISPGDVIAVICASEVLATKLRTTWPEIEWDIHIPPLGTEPGTPAFASCVDFVTNARARFVFVCLGAPKSEAICHAVWQNSDSAGTALCTGASLEFMLGMKRRAPSVMRRFGLEWFYRMVTEPYRLSGRYVSAVIPLLRLWLRERGTE